MNTTSRVATKSFVPGTSRARRDAPILRQQFEDWLTHMAETNGDGDNDPERGKRLTALFERSDFTRQRDLADQLGVETRTVQRWLAGEGMAKRFYKPLADALGTTVRWAIHGEELTPTVDEARIETRLDEMGDQLQELAASVARLTDLLLEEQGSDEPPARGSDPPTDDPPAD